MRSSYLNIMSSIASLLCFSCQSEFFVANLPPIANGGLDRVITLGEIIFLDGSSSYDPEGQRLSFSWIFISSPQNSTVNITGNKEKESFVADKVGIYLVGLVVTDIQMAKSELDVIRIRVIAQKCDSDSECNDNQACTTDICVNGYCEYQPRSDGDSCDDKLFCTKDDICIAGVCTGTPHFCSEFSNSCNQTFCDEEQDVCRIEPHQDQTPCDDNNWCTVEDVCQQGQCKGIMKDCGEPEEACHQKICNSIQQNCESIPIEDGQPCDDGLFCTVGDLCQAGKCVSGSLKDCSSQAGGCVDGVCDEQLDKCIGTFLPAGTACNDDLYCTINDRCNDLGVCVGTNRQCDFLDSACSHGRCDEEQTACVADSVPNGSACDDGLFCSNPDTCQNGICTGPMRDCSWMDTSECELGVCDDKKDKCVVVDKEDGEDCDDGQFCTVQTTCKNGLCAGVERDCREVADQCNDPSCDETLNLCVPIPVENRPCEDGLFCTAGDTCNSKGICVSGNEETCKDECQNECDEKKDKCKNIKSGVICTDDNIFCNGSSECDGHGHCEPTNISPCSETNCNHCQEEDLSCLDPVDTPCSDGKFCNGQEKCSVDGVCLAGQNPCPETSCEHCQEDKDSCFDPPDTPCEDDVFCTINTTCLEGQCQGGEPNNCAELVDDCNLAECDEQSDRCEKIPLASGTLCLGPDNEPCNSACNNRGECIEGIHAEDKTSCLDDTGICCGGVCQVGYSCCASGDCDDRNLCTTNSCSKGKCTFGCADDSCFVLDMEPKLVAGEEHPLRIHTCKADFSPSSFQCLTNRNYQGVFYDDFEEGLDSYILSGDVSQQTNAQNPSSDGTLGISLCNRESSLIVPLDGKFIDIGEQIELSFWAKTGNQKNNSQFHVEYFDGKAWSTLFFLEGDQAHLYLPYRVLIPKDGIGRAVILVRFHHLDTMYQENTDTCSFIDDLSFRHFLPVKQQVTLTQATISVAENKQFPLLIQNNDVAIQKPALNAGFWNLQGNTFVGVVSNAIDTTGLSNQDQLLVRFSMAATYHLHDGEYCQSEYSTDGGKTFSLISSIDSKASLEHFRYFTGLLPFEAIGIDNLRIRFLCLKSSDSFVNDELILDDFLVYVQSLDWIDNFSEFFHEGQGVYTTTLYTTQLGRSSVSCRYRGSDFTNWISFTVD